MDITEIQFVPLAREGVFAVIDYADRDEILAFRWHIDSKGYAVRTRRKAEAPGRRWVTMHREVCAVAESDEIDHINRNKLDNRKANLRAATSRQNKGNVGLLRTNSSGFRGVSWDPGSRRWRARISAGDRNIHLGRFANKGAAARAYDDVARRSFGAFAQLNFPDES